MTPPAPPLHGNAGEWSEAYVWCRLLADGYLDLADANLKAIAGRSQEVHGVCRREGNQVIQHSIEGDEVISINLTTKTEIARVKRSELGAAATRIIRAVVDQAGREQLTELTYAIPSVEELLRRHGFLSLPAASLDKADIQVLRSDPRAPGVNPDGYSVKSRLGQASTLLNPGEKTNFRFRVEGPITAEMVEQINAIDTRPRTRNKLMALEDAGCTLVFDRVRGPIFQLNLEVIDSRLPELVAHALLGYYRDGINSISDAAAMLLETNPMGYDLQRGHPFYDYKLKRLLQDVALGMRPESSVWDGVYDATAGYIVVREDGRLVAFNLYNLNAFQDYLFLNTKFDKPSEHRFDYGYLRQDEGETYIDLCLQVRFIR